MVNINKLKGKVIENGLTMRGLAEKLGIDKATLYRRIGAEGETFTVKEVNIIIEVLHLSNEEAFQIFFNQNVA